VFGQSCGGYRLFLGILGRIPEEVKEQAQMQAQMWSSPNMLERAALAPNAKLSELQTQVRDAIALSTPKSQAGLKTVVTSQLLSAEIPAREDLLAPVFKTQSLSMVYSKRGTGKTFFCLAIACAVASGSDFLGWTSPRPRGVLYVDAELPVATLQERVLELSQERIHAISESLNLDLLSFITPDLQSIPMPDLGTRQGQILIEDQINGHELLVLDNLSALVRSGKENEGEGWLPVQEWALSLWQKGISVLFVHHAGKSGAQRGTSRREDVLDLVIALRQPSNYSSEEGLRCEVCFEKCRTLLGDSAKSFEVQLAKNVQGNLEWKPRSIEDVLANRVSELTALGLSVRDIADELGIPKSNVQRIKEKQKLRSVR
jgi:putative DNA primase/helicase